MENKGFFDQEWEQDVAMESGIREIQKSIRRRNWKIIATSILLTGAVLLGCVHGIIPAVERLYWNADEFTYGHRSDLEATLYAYTELFNPSSQMANLNYRRTGFASYDLEVIFIDHLSREIRSAGGTLTRNRLSMDQYFTLSPFGGYGFPRHRLPFPEFNQATVNATRSQLEGLPEYIRLEASLSFPEDITMEDLITFMKEYPTLQVTWVAIRCTEPTTEWTPICGMSPFLGGPVFDGMLHDYLFFDAGGNNTPLEIEQHFKSLLHYSADQVAKGRGLSPYEEIGSYDDILAYVEENGILTYGCLVSGTPQTLLDLLNHDRIFDMGIVDAWLDVQ